MSYGTLFYCTYLQVEGGLMYQMQRFLHVLKERDRAKFLSMEVYIEQQKN